MVRTKLNPSIPLLLRLSTVSNHRSIFVIIGSKSSNTVPTLYSLMNKTTLQRGGVLWCYKNELGFSSHRKKRMKKLKANAKRGITSDVTNDEFDNFLTQTEVEFCYYKDSQRVLGRTYNMVVLQDFDSLTPNILCRTLETCAGGGCIVICVDKVNSLKQIYGMTMDVHERYRNGGEEVKPRFNERFVLSLKDFGGLVVDEEFNLLPISKSSKKKLEQGEDAMSGTVVVEKKKTDQDVELEDIKEQLVDTPNVGTLLSLTVTLDQGRALLTFLESLTDRGRVTVAMTAARGRGKSASVGLCLAGAVGFGYGTVYVTSPSPNNLTTTFEFLLKGLKALKYEEHKDYTVKYSKYKDGRGDDVKVVTGVEVHRSHKQVVTYLPPSNPSLFHNADLIAVDEAAGIPLPQVKAIMGCSDMVFLSSTVTGYEGTGRALSLKLIKDIRERNKKKVLRESVEEAISSTKGSSSGKKDSALHESRWKNAASAAANSVASVTGGLKEIELKEPIRYGKGDPVEKWLNNLLALNQNEKVIKGRPAPRECELYSVDRDALFSYHKLSEQFLQRMMSLYTSAHYKNSPNDLQMLSDAPQHRVFVLLSPTAEEGGEEGELPDILAIVQVALEGNINKKNVEAQLARGQRSAGDLIPWTLAQQFGDSDFAKLSGARIVRLAVAEEVQGMGYGSRAVEELWRYFNGDVVNLRGEGGEDSDEEVETEEESEQESEGEEDGGGGSSRLLTEKLKPRKKLPPLLLPLGELKENLKLDWIGTSFGLTPQLFKFWSRTGMKMLYVRQTPNELTGEYSSIMLTSLPNRTKFNDNWLPAYVADARRRFLSLLNGVFREMKVRSALSILQDAADYTGKVGEIMAKGKTGEGLTKAEMTKKQRKQVNAYEKLDKNLSERGGVGGTRLGAAELGFILSHHDLKRLELYGKNLCDHHLITDLVGTVSRLYFLGKLGGDCVLSGVQGALLVGIGLQGKTVDVMVEELGLPSNQVLAMFNKAMRKISLTLRSVVEEKEEEEMFGNEKAEAREKAEKDLEKMGDVTEMRLDEEEEVGIGEAMGLVEEKNEDKKKKKKKKKRKSEGGILEDEDISRHAIKGTDEDWSKALSGGLAGSVAVKRKKEGGLEGVKRSADYYANEMENTSRGVGKVGGRGKKKLKGKDKRAIKEMGGLGE